VFANPLTRYRPRKSLSELVSPSAIKGRIEVLCESFESLFDRLKIDAADASFSFEVVTSNGTIRYQLDHLFSPVFSWSLLDDLDTPRKTVKRKTPFTEQQLQQYSEIEKKIAEKERLLEEEREQKREHILKELIAIKDLYHFSQLQMKALIKQGYCGEMVNNNQLIKQMKALDSKVKDMVDVKEVTVAGHTGVYVDPGKVLALALQQHRFQIDRVKANMSADGRKLGSSVNSVVFTISIFNDQGEGSCLRKEIIFMMWQYLHARKSTRSCLN
jgi:hypothetical protein